jgi:ATP-binding cassette subfamily B protein
LRKEVFTNILNSKYKNVDKLNISSSTTVISNDIETVGTVFLYFLRMFLKIPFLFLFSFFFMFYINKKYFLIVLLIIPILILILYFIFKKSFPYFELQQNSLDKVISCVDENLEGKMLVKITLTEKKQMKRFNKESNTLTNLDILSMKILTFSSTIIMSIIYFLTILILLLSKEIISNNMNIGSVMAFLEYLTILLSSLLMGGMIILLFSQSLVSFKRIMFYLKKETESNKNLELLNPNTITVDDISFSYNDNLNILEHVSFTINRKEKVALVGLSGSGKSTLLKLLAHMYDVKEGNIFIDNTNIKNYKLDNILYNPDQMFLFKGTISDNISFYKNKISDSAILVSDTNNILKHKNKGLNEEVNALYNNYSGGEINRITLARALNRNSDFLLLDDCLSATDLKTERKILKNIFKNYSDIGLIYVTSRLSSLELFDKIIVLNDGKVEIIGSLEQVLKNKVFMSMYEMSKEVYHEKY